MLVRCWCLQRGSHAAKPGFISKHQGLATGWGFGGRLGQHPAGDGREERLGELRIAGSKLKLAGDNPSNGVFFVDAATQGRTAVEASDIVTNNPSELLVVIPPLAAGKYTVEVVTQYAVSTLLKEPRTALFDKALTVL